MSPMLTSPTESVTVSISYVPNEKQAEFHGLPHKYRFFVGGWGNGKTTAGCAEAFQLMIEYPGSTGLIARKTLPELKATTLKQMLHGGGGDPNAGDWTGIPQELIRRHNKSDKEVWLINNSMFHYWPMDDPDKLSNLNLGWFLIDQAEEVQEEMLMMLIGRLRERKGPRKGLLLANPNGHDWIWRRCVQLKEAYPNHGLVHAKTSDNPNLPSDYMEQFAHMPEAWRKRFFEGSWDVFTGQIWPEFDPDVHLIRPLPIEDWWETCEGIDHGRRNPTSLLWVSFLTRWGHNYAFVIDEYLEAGKRVSAHAKYLLENRTRLGVNPYWTVIDASAAQKDPNTERSVIDEYYDHGIPVIPSDRHKIARVARVAEWLTLDPDVPHPITGEKREEGWPRLYLFNTCTQLAEHIPGYRYKPQPPNSPEDAKEEPLKKDDHDVDALGYILMMRPPPGSKPIIPEHNEDPRARAYWERQKNRNGSRHQSRYGAV